MRIAALAWLLLASACAPKAGPAADGATSAPEATETPPPPKLERLPVDALLWEGPAPEGVEASQILDKTGTLTRMTAPKGEAVARWWPFAIDYWAIRRTDLEPLLAPHVGRTVRVTGHFVKIYDDGSWIYEVEPVKIVAVADPPEPAD